MFCPFYLYQCKRTEQTNNKEQVEWKSTMWPSNSLRRRRNFTGEKVHVWPETLGSQPPTSTGVWTHNSEEGGARKHMSSCMFMYVCMFVFLLVCMYVIYMTCTCGLCWSSNANEVFDFVAICFINLLLPKTTDKLVEEAFGNAEVFFFLSGLSGFNSGLVFHRGHVKQKSQQCQ